MRVDCAIPGSINVYETMLLLCSGLTNSKRIELGAIEETLGRCDAVGRRPEGIVSESTWTGYQCGHADQSM